jgi:hypothetical protein
MKQAPRQGFKLSTTSVELKVFIEATVTQNIKAETHSETTVTYCAMS